METSIVIAGFGGQGVLFAGQLLAYAGMDNNLHVTWIPSYGPEMRGGTANCTVIVADEPVGAPIVANPDVAIVLNLPSLEKYEPLVKSGGLLVVNSSLITRTVARTDVDVAYVPANDIAEELGSAKMMNMAALGALLAQRPILTLDQLMRTLDDHLPARKAHLLEANKLVIQKGYAVATAVLA
ncbi:MAG: 2-oxoacid:acceptor oxidoreductase family protein [Ardenticatenaceae bacterium]|nr:2-oxoacid:acceptor oxidoreductase family protein [Ardenticatenaceae bacterium]